MPSAPRRAQLDLEPGQHLDPPLAKGPQDDVDDVLVAPGQEGVEGLDDRHPSPEVGQEGGELAPDGAAADDGDGRRDALEGEELVRGDDGLTVDLETREGPRHRPWSEHDVAPLHHRPRLRAIDDLDAPSGQQLASAVEDRDLARPQQAGQTPVELVDDADLAGLVHREVDGRGGGGDPELARALYRAVDGGRLQELLGGHAPSVQARPADLVPLDHRDRQSGGCPVEGGRVATGAATDHHDVERLRLRRRHLRHRLLTLFAQTR